MSSNLNSCPSASERRRVKHCKRTCTVSNTIAISPNALGLIPGERVGVRVRESEHEPDTHEELKLDELDEAIIEQLVEDGRASYTDIADRLNVAANTVRNRVRSLVDRGAIDISAYPNPNRGKSSLRVQMAFIVDAGKLLDVAKRFSECEEIQYLAITSGNFDLVALATFGGRDDMLRFITSVVGRTPGVGGMKSSIILEVAKSRGRVLSPKVVGTPG